MSAAQALSSAMTPITVEVMRGPHQGLKHVFQLGKWTVGRGPENALVLAQDLKISRTHIEIQTLNSQVFVRNISQKNIMMVDGMLAVETILKPDAVIQIGDSYLRFRFERPPDKTNLRAVASGGSTAGGQSSLTPFGSANSLAAKNQTSAPAFPGVTGAASSVRPPPPPAVEIPLLSHPRFRFFAILVGIGLAGLWLYNQEDIKRSRQGLRDGIVVSEEVGKSNQEVERIREEIKTRGLETPQYRLAEAQFIKGFRDYQQGQYGRAMEAFQSARSFYPEHPLATRYWTLAKRKFDERVQQYMLQGRRYLGTQNYRLCESSYATALMLLKDDKNPTYQEARQFYDECRLKASRM